MKTVLEAAYNAIDAKQGENIKIIDIRSANPLVDYFVIASANNCRKANAIIDEIYEECDKEGIDYRPNTNSKDSGWMLADLGEVVCHIFVGEERIRYNLEGLWKDLPEIKM